MENKRSISPAKLTDDDLLAQVAEIRAHGFGSVNVEVKNKEIKEITVTKTLRST